MKNRIADLGSHWWFNALGYINPDESLLCIYVAFFFFFFFGEMTFIDRFLDAASWSTGVMFCRMTGAAVHVPDCQGCDFIHTYIGCMYRNK